jgi:Nickel responsive protein SCO4226-like
MKKYVIEREIPQVGSLQEDQLREAAVRSNRALSQLGSDIQWQESYVAGDKTFCVYLAKDESIIRRHAELSGLPATKITEITKVIDPTTATTNADSLTNEPRFVFPNSTSQLLVYGVGL